MGITNLAELAACAAERKRSGQEDTCQPTMRFTMRLETSGGLMTSP